MHRSISLLEFRLELVIERLFINKRRLIKRTTDLDLASHLQEQVPLVQMGDHLGNGGPLDVIDMANDKARVIREYVVFDPQILDTSILRHDIEVAQFEFNPMIFRKH